VVRKSPKLKHFIDHCDRMKPYYASLQGMPWKVAAKVHSQNHVDDAIVNNQMTPMHTNEQVDATPASGHVALDDTAAG